MDDRAIADGRATGMKAEDSLALAQAHRQALRMGEMLLDGGFSLDEIQAIMRFATPYMRDRRIPTYDEAYSQLTQRGLSDDLASIFADAFSKAA